MFFKMHYFEILLEPVTLLNMLSALLATSITDYTNIDFSNVYALSGYKVGSQELIVSTEKLNYDDMISYCKSLRLDVYSVGQNHDVKKIMEHYGLDDIWTVISKNKRNNRLVDANGFYPLQMTDYHPIMVADVKVEEIDATHHIFIQKSTTGVIEYKKSEATVLRSALCVRSLGFPKREIDVETMTEYRETVVKLFVTKQTLISRSLQKIHSVLATLPQMTANFVYEKDATFNLQKHCLKEIQDITLQLQNTLSKFKTLKDVMDFSIMTMSLQIQSQKIESLVDSIFEPFLQPKVVFEALYLPLLFTDTYDTTTSLPIVLNTKKKNSLYVVRVGHPISKLPVFTTQGGMGNFVNYQDFYKITLADIALLAVGMLGIIVMLITMICLRRPERQTRIYKVTNPIEETENPIHANCSRPTRRIRLPTTMQHNKANVQKHRVKFSKSRVHIPVWQGSSDLDDY